MLVKFMDQCVVYAVAHCPHLEIEVCLQKKCGRKLFPPSDLNYIDMEYIDKYLKDDDEEHVKGLPSFNWARSLKAAGVKDVYRVKMHQNLKK